MSRTIRVWIAIWLSTASLGMAAAIPAGTVLIAGTVDPVWSHDSVGTPFKAKLIQDVSLKGKVLLPAGTPVTGVIEQSFRRPGSGPLRVNLKAVSVNGRNVPVQTTGAYTLHRFQTKRGVSVSGREYAFPRGTRMGFQLARSLSL